MVGSRRLLGADWWVSSSHRCRACGRWSAPTRTPDRRHRSAPRCRWRRDVERQAEDPEPARRAPEIDVERSVRQGLPCRRRQRAAARPPRRRRGRCRWPLQLIRSTVKVERLPGVLRRSSVPLISRGSRRRSTGRARCRRSARVVELSAWRTPKLRPPRGASCRRGVGDGRPSVRPCRSIASAGARPWMRPTSVELVASPIRSSRTAADGRRLGQQSVRRVDSMRWCERRLLVRPGAVKRFSWCPIERRATQDGASSSPPCEPASILEKSSTSSMMRISAAAEPRTVPMHALLALGQTVGARGSSAGADPMLFIGVRIAGPWRRGSRLGLVRRPRLVARRLGGVALLAQSRWRWRVADVGEQRHAAARLGARGGEPCPGARPDRDIPARPRRGGAA